MTELYIPKSALVVVAHPDDIEYSCAGTMALWADGGAAVTYVLCTSGDSGIDHPDIDRQRAMEIREEEQRAAAEIIGAQEVIFLRHRDGMLQPNLELRKELVGIIRRVRPEVVVTGDPTLIWMNPIMLNHPDHRAASLATLEAAWPTAGQANLYPDFDADESMRLHRPKKILCTGWTQPQANFFVDISSTLDRKVQSLEAHKSQMRGFDMAALLRHQATANAAGQDMELAEAFRMTSIVDDEWWEKTQGDPTAARRDAVSSLA
jgi:LmbE family N-acetylglucosaminyl deacetylase